LSRCCKYQDYVLSFFFFLIIFRVFAENLNNPSLKEIKKIKIKEVKMKWDKSDWGSFLMGMGALLVVFSVPLSLQLMSSIGVNLAGMVTATAAEVPPISISSLIAGVVLLAVGAYLKGFFGKYLP
jgi:hypothetical protein